MRHELIVEEYPRHFPSHPLFLKAFFCFQKRKRGTSLVSSFIHKSHHACVNKIGEGLSEAD